MPAPTTTTAATDPQNDAALPATTCSPAEGCGGCVPAAGGGPAELAAAALERLQRLIDSTDEHLSLAAAQWAILHVDEIASARKLVEAARAGLRREGHASTESRPESRERLGFGSGNEAEVSQLQGERVNPEVMGVLRSRADDAFEGTDLYDDDPNNRPEAQLAEHLEATADEPEPDEGVE
jgi:hypothetical protein